MHPQKNAHWKKHPDVLHVLLRVVLRKHKVQHNAQIRRVEAQRGYCVVQSSTLRNSPHAEGNTAEAYHTQGHTKIRIGHDHVPAVS
jgi:hypothetical protein